MPKQGEFNMGWFFLFPKQQMADGKEEAHPKMDIIAI